MKPTFDPLPPRPLDLPHHPADPMPPPHDHRILCRVPHPLRPLPQTLRLARAHTKARDLIVLDHAYHGNTTTLIDISPYKHDGPGGAGTRAVAPQEERYRSHREKTRRAA